MLRDIRYKGGVAIVGNCTLHEGGYLARFTVNNSKLMVILLHECSLYVNVSFLLQYI